MTAWLAAAHVPHRITSLSPPKQAMQHPLSNFQALPLRIPLKALENSTCFDVTKQYLLDALKQHLFDALKQHLLDASKQYLLDA